MPLNNAAMVLAANTLRTNLAYAQLHSAAAGTSGTSNVTTAGRLAVTWAAATGPGTFTLLSALNFTGGAANGPVYSVTLWDASSGGNFYGEFPLTGGDTSFNSSGAYSVTMIDLTGTAT